LRQFEFEWRLVDNVGFDLMLLPLLFVVVVVLLVLWQNVINVLGFFIRFGFCFKTGKLLNVFCNDFSFSMFITSE